MNEASDILGISQGLPAGAQGPKHLLEYVVAHIAEFKKLNQDVLNQSGASNHVQFGGQDQFLD